ncbi:DUF6497 family protein [Epibacterium ulvae]|uniref:DUF6497 family protein n=1 Tax=Epibacterium ulvae TaxID=1156985 RepID=UPI00248FD9B1|nr:DUF6497 family protein [Epibacterium ulvae]
MIPSPLIKLARTAGAAPAAPAGGGPFLGCRGCGILFVATFFIALLGCVLNVSADELQRAKALKVPSRQPVTLMDAFVDDAPGAPWLRLRFVAPKIADPSLPHAEVAGDMDHLCNHVALPYMDENSLTPERIVISLSDRELAFGARDVTAVQYFEVYRPEAGACIWEGL